MEQVKRWIKNLAFEDIQRLKGEIISEEKIFFCYEFGTPYCVIAKDEKEVYEKIIKHKHLFFTGYKCALCDKEVKYKNNHFKNHSREEKLEFLKSFYDFIEVGIPKINILEKKLQIEIIKEMIKKLKEREIRQLKNILLDKILILRIEIYGAVYDTYICEETGQVCHMICGIEEEEYFFIKNYEKCSVCSEEIETDHSHQIELEHKMTIHQYKSVKILN